MPIRKSKRTKLSSIVVDRSAVQRHFLHTLQGPPKPHHSNVQRSPHRPKQLLRWIAERSTTFNQGQLSTKAGLKRIEIAEYPEEAIREAIVNALAHRDYEDATRHIVVEIFKDRIVFSSPGGPPGNAKMAVINRGTAKSRARNPLIAQGLRFMQLMEERGTGILRMKAAMLGHGLDEPKLAIDDDYFVVTLPGPGENLDRIRVTATQDQQPLGLLSERQQKIVQQALLAGSVTASWCVENMDVSRNTAFLDINHLAELKYLQKDGVGRGTKYQPGEAIQ